MKVIVSHITCDKSASRFGLMADSAILFSPRPLFVPDWLGQPVLTPALAVRISRQGKCIERRFATRYWDAATAAFIVGGHDGDTLSTSFDGALMLGDMVGHSDSPTMTVTVTAGGRQPVDFPLDNAPEIIGHEIAAVSQRMTWKTGDLLCLTLPGQMPTEPGQHLHADCNGTSCLDINIK